MPQTDRLRPAADGSRQRQTPTWHTHGTALVAVTRTGAPYWQVYVRRCPGPSCRQPHFHRTRTPLQTMAKTGPCGFRYLVHLDTIEGEVAA